MNKKCVYPKLSNCLSAGSGEKSKLPQRRFTRREEGATFIITSDGAFEAMFATFSLTLAAAVSL